MVFHRINMIFILIFVSFFASIIPTEHSIGTSPLLYSVWDDIDISLLSVWCMVEIPYGKDMENGIITSLYENCPIDEMSEQYLRIKSISRIITSHTLLASYQIQMIEHICRKYMIPIHRVLAIFLSRPILSRLERKNYKQILSRDTHDKKSSWKKSIHIVQDGIVTPNIVESYTTDHPTIVILPDDFAMMPYQIYHEDRSDILFVPSDMTDTRRAQAWIDIANGKYNIIYWTRRIIYYNLEAYAHIVYIEDALGPDYWHYPIRMRYIDILQIFATTNTSISLTILTSMPILSTLSYFRDADIQNI